MPGQESTAVFFPRIVDREYPAVWVTLQAALRNEGALIQTEDQKRGVIETFLRLRPGTKVWTRGSWGEEGTRNPQVQVRYSVQARPLGSEKTEVRLRTQFLYLDRGSGQWVPGTDDGAVMESFWRRFEQDLAYYGARPETWRPEDPGRKVSPPGSGPAQGSPGRQAPEPPAR